MAVRAEEIGRRDQTGNLLNDETLLNGFEFHLEGHEPVDPPADRGEVIDIIPVENISIAGNQFPDAVRVFEVRVKDPYIAADPKGFDMVSHYNQRMEDAVVAAEGEAIISRDEASREQKYNPYTRAWTSGSNFEGVAFWRSLVPTALALDYLMHPHIGKSIYPRGDRLRENGVPISKESALQMRFAHDAIAIRERAAAMQEIAETHLFSLARYKKEAKWLSLASGTAEPAIAAAKSAENSLGIAVDLTVTDMDDQALAYVVEKAGHYGFDSSRLHDHQTNILLASLREELAEVNGLEDQQYDVVENMGFKEYLPQDGDELKARTRLGLPQASDFTRHAYSFVKPGGALISGNMVLPPNPNSLEAIRKGNVRTQLHYVLRIVDWPLINARSEDQILKIYKEAGILDDPNSQIELFRVVDDTTGLHIYDIVKVTKLA